MTQRADWTFARNGLGRLVVARVAYVTAYGVASQKYILQLRGVVLNAVCRRDPGATVFDDEARTAIRRTVDYAKRWFKS